MIKFSLLCAQDHEFEGWFRDGAAYDAQTAAGEVCCPLCGSAEVRKALMAPSVVSSKQKGAMPPELVSQFKKALVTLRQNVESHCENVGDRFAEEAKRMHYGETEERPIYGQSTPEERDELRDEGIEVVAIPWLPSEN